MKWSSVSHISLGCKWLNSSWTCLGKMRNVDSWNVMKTWTLKTWTPWELQGCRWMVRKNWNIWSKLPGDFLSKSSCFCFSLCDGSLLFPWRLASSVWQETLLSHFLSPTPCNFYYGWWIQLHFLRWKVKNCKGREVLSTSRPVYCSLGREDGVIDEHGYFLRTTWFDWGKSISKRMGVKFIERGTVDR